MFRFQIRVAALEGNNLFLSLWYRKRTSGATFVFHPKVPCSPRCKINEQDIFEFMASLD